jgi:hypothetical protein
MAGRDLQSNPPVSTTAGGTNHDDGNGCDGSGAFRSGIAGAQGGSTAHTRATGYGTSQSARVAGESVEPCEHDDGHERKYDNAHDCAVRRDEQAVPRVSVAKRNDGAYSP